MIQESRTTVDKHVTQAAAVRWFTALDQDARPVFCRFTQFADDGAPACRWPFHRSWPEKLSIYRRSSFSSNLLIASFFWPGLIQADIALSETLNPDE